MIAGLVITLIGIVILGWGSKRMIDTLKLAIGGVETTLLATLTPSPQRVPVFEGWEQHVTNSNRILLIGFLTVAVGIIVQIIGLTSK
jgi:hypothetical protein